MDFGQVHHIEYYVSDLEKSNQFWNWFLQTLGYTKYSEWDGGISWAHRGGTYLVFCQVYSNYLNEGYSWKNHGISSARIAAKCEAPISKGIPQLWDQTKKMLDESIDAGNLAR